MKRDPIALVESVVAAPNGFCVYHTRGRMFLAYGAEVYRGHLQSAGNDMARGVRDEAGARVLAAQLLDLARKQRSPKPEIERAPLNLGVSGMTRFIAWKVRAA